MALKTVKIEPGDAQAASPQSSPDSVSESTSIQTTPPAPAPSPPRKKRGLLLIGLPLVAIAAAGWFGVDWFLNGRFNITTDNAQVRSDITNVTPRVQGYVTRVHVIENQPVKAGDLLIELESADFENRVAQAKAELAQAEADAAQAEARIAAQRDALAEAEAAWVAADATADWSNSDANRLADLSAKGWYPKAKVEQADAARKTANAKLNQANASITAQRSQLASSQAAAQSANAKVDAAKAKLAAAELDLSRTQIRAPVDGTVTNKRVAEGQLMNSGTVALAIVQSTDKWVIANFKETQIANMKPGQCVNIHVDAYPDLKVQGSVQSIAPSTGATFSLVPQDTATGNFTKIVQRVPVKIVLDKQSLASDVLQAGLMVTASVSTKPGCE